MRRVLMLASAIALLLSTTASAFQFAAGWGVNVDGSLGAGYKGTIQTKPVPTLGGAGAVELCASGATYARMPDGSVKAWGGNGGGQLADGTRIGKLNPVTIKLEGPATQIACAGEHALALLSNGTVETWGANLYGQLGDGTTAFGKEACVEVLPAVCRSLHAIPVPHLTEVCSVYAGGAEDGALLCNGTAELWGENRKGQLGDGTTIEKDVPTPVKGISGIRSIAMGAAATLGGHTEFVLSNGTVVGVGLNSLGQLGDGTKTDSLTPVPVRGLTGVVELSASWTHNLARLSNGRVLAWGDDVYGAIGSSATTSCGTARKPLACVTVPTVVPTLGEVTAVSAGFNFSLAAAAGKAYSWGRGEYGRLGDGAIANRTAPGPLSGLSDVEGVAAAEGERGFATLSSSTLKPGIEVVPGQGALTVRWEGASSANWYVQERPAPTLRKHAGLFSPKITLAPTTRAYTFTGLEAGRPYEVSVQEAKRGPFGRRVAEGTPTAAGVQR